MDCNQINQNFQAAMLLHGITPPQQIIGDGKLCRFHVQGDKKGSNPYSAVKLGIKQSYFIPKKPFHNQCAQINT